VSQLVDSASGIHARHSDYYIRTVRGDNKDPLTQFMIAQGIPNEPDVMKPDTTTVFSFPMKSPDGAVTRNDMTAIEQLEFWLTYQRHWCEHKPSVTVSVRDHEWLDVGAWVYRHFDEVSGISFLPHSDHTYQQAPYQDCTREEYEAMLADMPAHIDWSGLAEFEREDTTKGSQTMACSAGVCELVDLSS
jgi:ribonucleoside-diphosphate reductase alpha chain